MDTTMRIKSESVISCEDLLATHRHSENGHCSYYESELVLKQVKPSKHIGKIMGCY